MIQMPPERLSMSNVLKPSVSPIQIRNELEQMVVADLLGPAGGPTEEVDERSVRDRYLVGVLAPRKQRSEPAAREAEEEDEFPPIIADELPEGGADSLEDGPTELSATLPKDTSPSSLGMSFCVDGEVTAIQVTARWGQFVREPHEHLLNAKTGNPRRIWKRHPRGGKPYRVALQDGPLAPVAVDPECEQVYVQGLVRRREKSWIATLFLVNGQEEPPRGTKEGKDSAWLFQPELTVEAPDGVPIFCKKVTRRSSGKTDAALRAEDDALAMLYRRNVEFAVGHGVSVQVETAPGCKDQAVRISTRITPSYEVPRTTPPTVADAALNPAFGLLAGLVRDMKVLAETDPADLWAKLEPLVTAYQAWIDSQAKRLADSTSGLAEHQAPAEAALKRCRTTLMRIKEGIDLLEADPRAAEAFRFMNRAMWLQRTHSIYSEAVRRGNAAEVRGRGHPR